MSGSGKTYKLNKQISFEELVDSITTINTPCNRFYLAKSNKQLINDADILFLTTNEAPIGCYPGIELPIYMCSGFREYGVNLCDPIADVLEKI